LDPLRLIATGSSLVNSAMGERAVCVALLNMRGYTKEALAKPTPAARLGIQVKKDQ
jgi:D-arabinose 5-phosphate isomerase GutQ